MIKIKVCIGSSCFLKKAPEIVEFLSKKIEGENLSDKILLSGSFCAGKCNRVGVTIFINDDIYTGITIDAIQKLWDEKVAPLIK